MSFGASGVESSTMLENHCVFDLAQTTDFIEAILLPLIGCCTLFHAKFGCGEAARSAERRFLALLIVLTLVTLRTVIACDEAWLVHTTALGTLIIASLMIPGQQTSPVI